jgi:hypothetical protein
MVEKMENTNVKTQEQVKTEPEGFDMSAFALAPENVAIVVQKIITQVPVRKPDKQKFIRRDSRYEPFLTQVLELKEDNEYYIVHSSLVDTLAGETKTIKLYVCYDQRGNQFLCPVPQPDTEGKWNSWHKSLAEVMDTAATQWVRVIPDKAINGYSMMASLGRIPEPRGLKGPEEMPLAKLLELAFKDKILRDENSPVIMKLRGLI